MVLAEFGRLVIRAIAEKKLIGKEVDVVAIVDITNDAKYFAYQLKYDSIHGKFDGTLSTEKDDPGLDHDGSRKNGDKTSCLHQKIHHSFRGKN